MESIESYIGRLFKFRLRTEKEIIERCSEKGFCKEEIFESVEKMKRNGLINDLRFSKMFLEDGINLKKKGYFLLNVELRKLGVEKEIISEAINSVSQELSEIEILFKELEEGNFKDLNKWKNRMYRRGFSSDAINKAMELFEENK